MSAPPTGQVGSRGMLEWLGYHGPMVTGMLLPLSGGGFKWMKLCRIDVKQEASTTSCGWIEPGVVMKSHVWLL